MRMKGTKMKTRYTPVLPLRTERPGCHPELPLRDFLHNGLSGYTFDGPDGVCIVLSPKYDVTASEILHMVVPPAINIKSVEIRLLSPDKSTCMSQTAFVDVGDTDTDDILTKNNEILKAAQKFALLHAVKYFQEQAMSCMNLYEKCN